jgi:hypothetical protein
MGSKRTSGTFQALKIQSSRRMKRVVVYQHEQLKDTRLGSRRLAAEPVSDRVSSLMKQAKILDPSWHKRIEFEGEERERENVGEGLI